MAEKEAATLDDNNIYLFMDNFSSATVKPVIEWILKKSFLPTEDKPKFLTLVINSPGGDATSAFALIDIMKGSSIPIRTVGLGQVASCGLLTFMSGEKGHRSLTPNTSILSHQFAWASYGKAHELFARVKEFELTNDRIFDHYKKITDLSEKEIKTYLLPESDVWLTAQEAIRYGLADSIITTY